jgi:hypothetical protein
MSSFNCCKPARGGAGGGAGPESKKTGKRGGGGQSNLGTKLLFCFSLPLFIARYCYSVVMIMFRKVRVTM